MNAIEINNLSFSYPEKRRTGLFSLSVEGLAVRAGEFLSILGPNGCGKSTLLRVIPHLLTAQSGDVKIFGRSIHTYPQDELAKEVTYVRQTNTTVFPYSVYEMVMMGRTPYLNLLGFEKREDREIVGEAMERMQVSHLAEKGINEVSGGEAQRVFIARALAQKSKIILLDEPNAHLDIEHQIMIFEMMRELNRDQKITIVTVSHDLNLVGVFADRIVIMDDGRIQEDGFKKDILTAEKIKKYFRVDAQILNEIESGLNVLVKPNVQAAQ